MGRTKGFELLNNLRYSTVKLVVPKQSGGVGFGTGFFFDMEYMDGSHCLLLVTNKHMADDWQSLSFRINKMDDKKKPILGDTVQITLKNSPSQRWIEHPDVDLCVFEVWPHLKPVLDSGTKLCFRYLHEGLIPKGYMIDNVSPIEDILMIGYPDAMADDKNNLPIVRRGITATDFKVDYNGKKEFLIDASIFKGSSGSPVMICHIGSFPNPDGTLLFGERMYFLGVQYRGEFTRFQDPIYARDSNGVVQDVNGLYSRNFNDLGFCVKSECMMYFKDIIKQQGWAMVRTK